MFGLGLAITVAPLTATVLQAADRRHAGIASGVNNAIARSRGCWRSPRSARSFAQFAAAVDQGLRGARLDPAARAVAGAARDRPLAAPHGATDAQASARRCATPASTLSAPA